MGSSGTVGATVYRAQDLADAIAKRCGVMPANLTPEGLDTIFGVMWRTLAAWSNRGVNLWRMYHALYPVYQGQQVYQLAQGDIDVHNAVLRQPIRLSASSVTSSNGGTVANLSDGLLSPACTQLGANGNFVWDWGASVTQSVGLVGVNSAAARAYNLVMSSSADGLTYNTVLAPGSVTYTAGGWQWYEIDPAGAPVEFFKISETGGAILSLGEVVLASNWSDIPIGRWSRDDWANQPNKRSPGRPTNYYEERLLTPQISLWSVPDATQRLNCMALWIHRHIEDVGAPSNTLNIPERWYQPLVDMCSFIALPEVPNADIKRYEMLKDIAMGISLPDAEKEERDSGLIKLSLGVGAYTR